MLKTPSDQSSEARRAPAERPVVADLAAIMVTYHPDADLGDRVQRIRRQVGRLVIVDNGSGEETRAMLTAIRCAQDVEVICNERNLGVAAALNQGFQRAQEADAWGVLAFDQDTVVTEGLAQSLLDISLAASEREPVGIVGANFVHAVSGLPGYRLPVEDGRAWFETGVVITSGSLVPIASYRAIGPFWNGLFIDKVDEEYCLRARQHGYQVLIARDTVMRHALGTARQTRLLGKKVWTNNYSAFRWYYLTRNYLLVAPKYGRREPAWFRASTLSLCNMLIKMILLESERAVKLRAALRGLIDGLRRRVPEEHP